MSALLLAGVRKHYPAGGVGLHPLDLALAAGDRLVLLGPTGSGKSTLLRLIAGLEEPDAGTVTIGGVRADRLPPHRRGVALLAQRAALYPHLTVAQNLDLVSRGAGPSARLRPAANHGDAVELLRLEPLLARLPHQLSGGERQRVALAKLVARAAPVWLLDEPFAGLDPAFRDDFRSDLHLLLARTGATMILSTHDPADADALGQRVGVLDGGRLIQLGTPAALRDRPATRFVAAALGRVGLIDGRADGPAFVSACGAVRLPLPPGVALRAGPAGDLTVGVRPEDVRPASEHPNPSGEGAVLTGWPAVAAEPVGGGWLLRLARGRLWLRAWQSAGPPRVGEPADWFVPAGRCLWFDAGGRRIDF